MLISVAYKTNLKHMYNIEKLALNIQDKSHHEAEWRDFKNLFI